MTTPARRVASLALLGAMAGFASCREPTQITLRVTSDAACPAELERTPRIEDVLIVSGRSIAPDAGEIIPNAVTSQCDADGEPTPGQTGQNVIGTLVLLPGSEDDPRVEVMVIAGVRVSNDENDPLSAMSAGACAALLTDPESGGIEGQPCIVARRRLAFVDHSALRLPIELDTRCIGEECGKDLTCYQGNCVQLDVACPPDEPACAEPPGCETECELGCATGTATCVQGECQCLPCDEAECLASDACTSSSVGSCNEVSLVCECIASCSPEACEPPAVCEGSGCVSPVCDASSCSGACAGGTLQCVEIEGELACACIGDECIEGPCVAGEDCPPGQLGECASLPRGEACVCSCDDEECAADCESGCGSCTDSGACGCTAPCAPASCDACEPWQTASCGDLCGGCNCPCDDDACAVYCDGLLTTTDGGQCNPDPQSEECLCNLPTNSSSSATTTGMGGLPSGGGGTGGIGTAGGGGFGAGPSAGGGGFGAGPSAGGGGFGAGPSAGGGFGAGPSAGGVGGGGGAPAMCPLATSMGAFCEGMCAAYCGDCIPLCSFGDCSCSSTTN